MTNSMARKRTAPVAGKRLWAAMIVLGVFALGGCSGTNVGSSWQCPLAQGEACGSVAAADPAVPAPARTEGVAIREPLYRVRGGNAGGATAEPGNGGDCAGACDPFAWLARLLSPGRNDAGPPESSRERPAGRAPGQTTPGAGDNWGGDSGGEPAVEAGALPAEPEAEAGLRTEEAVARIWIAPFVDENGVYREASHVWVVLEPAGWRLP